MSLSDPEIQDLLDWGSSHQSDLHPNVEIYPDPVTGLSFKTRNDQPPGSTVVTTSHRISLSYLNAIEAPGFSRRSLPLPEEFIKSLSVDDPNIIGHFFLVQQYLMREASFWWPYIRLLPQPDQSQNLGIPIWWPQDDQKFLHGTNAEPPLQKRKDLWKAEWTKGIDTLQDNFADWQDYSYVLYQWAATIFGSRSFRASLTVQENTLQDPQALGHVRNDRFSVLLPILDIGNHNGHNNVDWISDSGGLRLTIRSSVPAGDQIFNYYGNKSNSELLVAYGFTLPEVEGSNLDRDVVNLRLKPSPDALSLRRSQRCHIVPQIAEEEYIFMFQKQPSRQSGLSDIRVFSAGLIDLIICMVANNRERRYIAANPDYCPESDENVMGGALSRSALQVLGVLHSKLSMEKGRIQEIDFDLPEPSNGNQKLALDYRHRQCDVLSLASHKIKKPLAAALEFSSFCQHTSHAPSTTSGDTFAYMHQHVELLSLECAFDWLRTNYRDIFDIIVSMIAEDQEESLPLDWAVLVEDWDHTYWIVWIFTIWMLWMRDGESFELRHKNLSSWLSQMNEAFDYELASDVAADVLNADTSEIETINLMTKGIAHIPDIAQLELQEWLTKPSSIMKLRSFASFVAQEETFTVVYDMQEGVSAEQKVLCISKSTRPDKQNASGAWIAFFTEAMRLRDHSQGIGITYLDYQQAQDIAIRGWIYLEIKGREQDVWNQRRSQGQTYNA